MAGPGVAAVGSLSAGQRIRARLITAFNTDEGTYNEIILTAIGNEVDASVHAPVANTRTRVLPGAANGRALDTICAGYGLERREREADEWLRERLGREVFGPKGTREALEEVLDGLFVREPEIVEWIRDQWFAGRSYLGVNAWPCDRTKVAYRVLVRVMDTRKTILRTGFFVGRSHLGEQSLYEEKLEYSVPMWFLWCLIRAVKPAGIEATIEVLN